MQSSTVGGASATAAAQNRIKSVPCITLPLHIATTVILFAIFIREKKEAKCERVNRIMAQTCPSSIFTTHSPAASTWPAALWAEQKHSSSSSTRQAAESPHTSVPKRSAHLSPASWGEKRLLDLIVGVTLMHGLLRGKKTVDQERHVIIPQRSSSYLATRRSRSESRLVAKCFNKMWLKHTLRKTKWCHSFAGPCCWWTDLLKKLHGG